MSEQPSIVLAHGAWADGSSWSGVIRLLQEAGYNVAAPQFPLTALATTWQGFGRCWRRRRARPLLPDIPMAVRS